MGANQSLQSPNWKMSPAKRLGSLTPQRSSPASRRCDGGSSVQSSPSHVSSIVDDSEQRLSLTDDERRTVDKTWRQMTRSRSSSPAPRSAPTPSSSPLPNGGGLDIIALPDDDAHEIGVRVFLRIFALEPDVQRAFPQFIEPGETVPCPERLARNVMFRCHARRFFRAVQSVVEHLDSLDVCVVPTLNVLGRQHRKFDGFEPRYLETFETAMDGVWKEELGRRYDRRARTAWRKVFRLITATVLSGYNEDGPVCCGQGTTPKTESTNGGGSNGVIG